MLRMGIDLGGTKIEGVVLDAGGAELFRRRVPTPSHYDDRINAIAALVTEAEAATGLCTVGVGTPGSISPHTTFMQNAEGLEGRPLREDIAAALRREIRMANDADCLALSEASDGAGAGHDVVFAAILGTGVGAGIVAHGRLLHRGPNATHGEWGHNPLPAPDDAERPGPACYCGRRGCTETFLNGRGLALAYREATGEDASPEDIARGDSPARIAALERYALRLAKSLATVINILDPDVIVLGGGLSNIDRLYDLVPPLLPRFVFSDGVKTPMVKARHGDASGVRGAARLWDRG
ncbi:ROK family protein [Emcibacter sp. SYSU 3D8]|uniref:ROK family protein n=1 Tax=Emcibacter sp. SYSU 3D8 TaxID=3133969 RepID=UPI0031FEFDEA